MQRQLVCPLHAGLIDRPQQPPDFVRGQGHVAAFGASDKFRLDCRRRVERGFLARNSIGKQPFQHVAGLQRHLIGPAILDPVGNRQNVGHGHVGNLLRADCRDHILIQNALDVAGVAVGRLRYFGIPAPGEGFHRISSFGFGLFCLGFLAGFQAPAPDEGLGQILNGGSGIAGDRVAALQGHWRQAALCQRLAIVPPCSGFGQ